MFVAPHDPPFTPSITSPPLMNSKTPPGSMQKKSHQIFMRPKPGTPYKSNPIVERSLRDDLLWSSVVSLHIPEVAHWEGGMDLTSHSQAPWRGRMLEAQRHLRVAGERVSLGILGQVVGFELVVQVPSRLSLPLPHTQVVAPGLVLTDLQRARYPSPILLPVPVFL